MHVHGFGKEKKKDLDYSYFIGQNLSSTWMYFSMYL
jgi:hypothetical protein